MAHHLTDYRAVILDIEGTTTPISFVYDVLFPYARTHLAEFIEAHWSSVQDEVEGLREQVEIDREAGVEDVVVIASGDDESVVRESVIRNLRWQMDDDRKTTALKSIQGENLARGL